MITVGIGGSVHDFSTCLIENGKIVCAIEEERITRKKYGYCIDITQNTSLEYCLSKAGIGIDDVDYFAVNDLLDTEFYKRLGRKPVIYNHHDCHAASTYYFSGFNEAAVLVIDHSGSRFWDKDELVTETVSYYKAEGKEINILQKVLGRSPEPVLASTNDKKPVLGADGIRLLNSPNNSIGRFYSKISKQLGCITRLSNGELHSEAGKMMGLSAYGSDKFYEEMKEFVKFLPNGQLTVNIIPNGVADWIDATLKSCSNDSELMKTKMDMAWAVQKILEDAVIHCANYLYDITRTENICVAGGVGLNGLANLKIIEKTPFKNIFIQPGAGDSGTSIGAAYLAYIDNHGIHNAEAARIRNNFWGKEYSEAEVLDTLRGNDVIEYKKYDDVFTIAAGLIANNKIIGWFQGGSEFGPRSLGNRSILANPCNPDMKDILNSQVKHRESYRPYAPSILAEFTQDYFDLELYTEYMLLIPMVKEDKRKVIPAVTHVDGTARVQTITKEFNERFYRLIHRFYEITSVPVVLNTSMNVMGEPICETPSDAVNCLINANLDYLVIGNYIAVKKGGRNSLPQQ